MDAGAAAQEGRVPEQFLVQRNIGLDALDHRFGERDAEPRDRLRAVVAVGDDLAEQGIVVRRHEIAVVGVRVHADAGAARHVERGDAPRRGRETIRILRVDAAFDGVAAELHVALPDRELLARGDADLLLHDVDAGDHLGHRMLDLEPRVDLDEVELAALEQELERRSALVTELVAGLGAALGNAGAAALVQLLRRRLLDDLLMPALHRAVAVAEMDRVAEPVREHLELDVARALQVLFQVDHGIPESGLRLGPRHLHGRQKRRLGVHDPHAAPAAAARRLDDHRVADRARHLHDVVRLLRQRPFHARHDRQSRLFHHRLGAHLVAQQADGIGLGADEDEAALRDALCEIRVFREKAPAGVHRLGVGHLRCADDGGDVEVACARRRRPDAHRFIRELDVLGLAIGLRVHHHRLDAELAARALDAQSDFAAVGDQDFFEHQPRMNSGSPYSTGWPFSTSMALTVPSWSASISFRSFMASMMQSVSPALTACPTSTNGFAPGAAER